MLIHRGRNIQQGSGLGGFLGNLFKRVWPVVSSIFSSAPVKQVASDVKDSALKAGLNLASDVIHGQNVKESLEKNAKSFGKNVGESVINAADSVLSTKSKKNKKPAKRPAKPKKPPKKKIKKVRLSYF